MGWDARSEMAENAGLLGIKPNKYRAVYDGGVFRERSLGSLVAAADCSSNTPGGLEIS